MITVLFLCLQFAAGCKAEVVGKPDQGFFLGALQDMQVPVEKVLNQRSISIRSNLGLVLGIFRSYYKLKASPHSR